MRDNGFKTTENRMLIRRGFFFLIYPSQRLCSHALPLSNPLAQGLFFYAPKFPFVSEKKGNKKKMEGHRERKRNNFVIPILSFAVNFIFFILPSPIFHVRQVQLRFRVCVGRTRERRNHNNNDYVNTTRERPAMSILSLPDRMSNRPD